MRRNEQKKDSDLNCAGYGANNDLTLILAIKDIRKRGYYRLFNSLYSISLQTVIPKSVIIMDGSCKSEMAPVKVIVDKFPFARHVWREQEVFNKPVLYNIGIRLADTEYLMMTDVDYIFEKNMVETVLSALGCSSNWFVLCQTHNLPPNFIPNKKMIENDVPLMKKLGVLLPPTASGALQAAKREWFLKVQGYDERLARWGGMDNDMVKRAKLDGLKEIWIQSRTAILHQHHESNKFKDPDAELQWQKNHYIYVSEKTVIRNQYTWDVTMTNSSIPIAQV